MLRARGLTKNGHVVFGTHVPLDIEALDTHAQTLQLTCRLSRREEFETMLEALCAPHTTVQGDLAIWETQHAQSGETQTFTGCFQTGRVTQEPAAPWVEVHLTITLTARHPAPVRWPRRRCGAPEAGHGDPPD